MIEVSVVVPIYRNRETVRELALQVQTALASRSIEIVFVNDACPENSGEVLDQLSCENPGIIRVLHQSQRGGQTAALLRGIAEARGKQIAVMDADLQDPPEALPRLLDELTNGNWGAVFAGRRGRYQSSGRMFTSAMFKGIVTRLSGIPRDAAGFVVFTNEVRDRILRFRLRHYYLPAMIGKSGLPVTSIPVERNLRLIGESAYSESMRWRVAIHRVLAAIELTRHDRLDEKGAPDAGSDREKTTTTSAR
jgi:glycosyltransferase involved in cell wall biosynthesis